MALKHAGTLVCHNILQNVMDLTSMVYEGAVESGSQTRAIYLGKPYPICLPLELSGSFVVSLKQ